MCCTALAQSLQQPLSAAPPSSKNQIWMWFAFPDKLQCLGLPQVCPWGGIPSLGISARLSCHTGIITLVQNSPIICLSWEQETVGCDFLALQIARDLIISAQYKLRMLGMPPEGQCKWFVKIQVFSWMSAFQSLNSQRNIASSTIMHSVKQLLQDFHKYSR